MKHHLKNIRDLLSQLSCFIGIKLYTTLVKCTWFDLLNGLCQNNMISWGDFALEIKGFLALNILSGFYHHDEFDIQHHRVNIKLYK